MNDTLVKAYLAAVKSVEDDEPAPLEPVAIARASALEPDADVSLSALSTYLGHAGENDRLKVRLSVALAGWDGSTSSWVGTTKPESVERRTEVYNRLNLDNASRETFDREFPVVGDGSDIISDEFVPWYTDARREEHQFYWSAYKNVLLKKGWAPGNISSLDVATSRVVERLSDPTRPEAFSAKGLVIGYVQSGKTANFTGVLAKSIDAGYRLVIVLTGTIDILRKQTQRRLDMEMIGLENIFLGVDPNDEDLARDIDYFEDPDRVAGKFVEHGFQPSDQGFPDIVRLTRHGSDYKSLNAGITALELGKKNKRKPLYDPENLFASDARVAIVKKNASVLRRLVRDLKRIRSQLSQIPTVIIDDESDQASINTSNPARWKEGEKKRTTINALISELLELLPRAQYVGYTATPYANVFVDAADSEDIFPKDFLLSLDRPKGYMGVADFHDIDFDGDESKTVENSNEKAFVRDLFSDGPGEKEERELGLALDSYVLGAAIKLYRLSLDAELAPGFKHHTMLIHETVRTADHKDLAGRVREAWRRRNYHTPAALARLDELLKSDFIPVSRARGEGQPTPESIETLRPFLADALENILKNAGDPVIIVNGDDEAEQQRLDFDKAAIWRILVGGTKLSRGFTVEGLTVSYYRRKTAQADTLMQMGRWFGFRPGYRDLVRLFIGRAEPWGRNSTVDLYDAFEAVVRDEEAFRSQLKKYAKLVDGKPQITPRDVPPLVSQHLPGLRPSAANKMYNAELVVRRSPGEPLEPVGYPTEKDKVESNYALMTPLLNAASAEETLTFPALQRANGTTRPGGTFNALVGGIDAEDFLAALRGLKWVTANYFKPDLSFIEEITVDGAVKDWLLINPQLRGERHNLPDVSLPRSMFHRRRRPERDNLFGFLSDPKHRPAAARVAQAQPSWGDSLLDEYARPNRGAVLLYPVYEDKDLDTFKATDVTVALVLVGPQRAHGRSSQVVQFRVKDPANPSLPIVKKPKSGLADKGGEG